MSHDLRTPLNTIQGFSQIILMNDYDQALHEKINKIYNASDQLLKLIEEILDFTAIDMGNINVMQESVKVKSFLEECVGSFLATNTSDISIQLEDINEDAYIEVDPFRLNQIMTNLLENAVKYNRPKGSVQIYCDYDNNNDGVTIIVKDTGFGIKSDELQLIFEPFYRSQRHMKSWKGTGIGLAIVAELTKRMNGKYGVKSEEGKGSVFWISFKSLDEADYLSNNVKRFTNRKLLSTGYSMNALYIEDNVDNIEVMKHMMKFIGDIELSCVTSGEAGIARTFEIEPEIILLDLSLPDINGFEVLAKIKANPITKDIPIIAVSADAMESTVKQASEEGCFAYITKPIEFKELSKVLFKAMKSIDAK